MGSLARNRPPLMLSCFLAGDEEYRSDHEKELDGFVRFFKGKKRIIRGEDEIKSARTSGDVNN